MTDLRRLASEFPFAGHLEAIFLRPARGQHAVRVGACNALEGFGLEGDRAAAGRRDGKRQVTLLQAEHLPAVAAFLQRPDVDAAVFRRNLLISGLNVLAAKALFRDAPMQLAIGAEVVLEITGPCEPCSKLAAALGEGSYNALRGHGGMTARVIRGGALEVGQKVSCRPFAGGLQSEGADARA